MSDVTPDVAGGDIKPLSELVAENEGRIERLQRVGYGEDVLNLIALQVRLEAVIATFPPNLRTAVEYRYELMLGSVLDATYNQATQEHIAVPEPQLIIAR